jgi:hypothetical protein
MMARASVNPAEKQRRYDVLVAANAAYQALRDNPREWQEELAERALWEGTLMDGIDDDEQSISFEQTNEE